MTMEAYCRIIAQKALELGAIRLSVDKPFLWASGYYMPIYNDNRSLLVDSETRTNIAKAFRCLLSDTKFVPDNIAGTATAGIPHATTLADALGKSLSYVRSSSKDHGLAHQIEGLGKDGTYENKNVLLIEDLVSTGKSSIAAVKAVVEAKGNCPYCFAIFTYGLEAAKTAFEELNPKCQLKTILDYDYVISEAKRIGYINEEEAKILSEWRTDPFGWGEKHGFKKVEK